MKPKLDKRTEAPQEEVKDLSVFQFTIGFFKYLLSLLTTR